MSDLQPIPPSEAIELYLDSMQDDSAEWTQTSHKSHLRAFREWCREHGGIDNMNDLNGRDLYQFRVWRREGGYSKGQNATIAPKTLDSALTTVRAFLRFCAQIEAVPEDLYEKAPLVSLSPSEEVSDSKMDPSRVGPILEYLDRYEYASRSHVIFLLLWHTGARIGGIRALDLQDCDLDGRKPGVDYVHRPESGTPLKNDEKGERFNRVSERVAQALQDYIEGPRQSITEDSGRQPLVTTRFGRASPTCIRDTLYKWSRPCAIGIDCPHDEDPATCEAATHDAASKCPSSRSPHDVRKARVTKYRNDGVHRGIVSDRLDASEQVLDKHYDRASKREKADRRWRQIQG
ncbi:tyrosine-type recombinase/integrase [Natrarchaeobius chitinivorans]|uniref:Site-specific integrase n=1 Tax=Natrarchaeobius chitinivorans TaxID=1679083 RepID=A0A3N6PH43_NATCH|nr:site-specific integrase [Natrarchaeobius chitinivorans]RQG97235.1 site-specific integrase [Natrarchaeobius chitinivorans]